MRSTKVLYKFYPVLIGFHSTSPSSSSCGRGGGGGGWPFGENEVGGRGGGSSGSRFISSLLIIYLLFLLKSHVKTKPVFAFHSVPALCSCSFHAHACVCAVRALQNWRRRSSKSWCCPVPSRGSGFCAVSPSPCNSDDEIAR